MDITKPNGSWLSSQEEFEKTDFYKYLKENGSHIKIRDEKDQPKPKPKWWEVLLCVLYGVHLSNRQSEIYRKLKK